MRNTIKFFGILTFMAGCIWLSNQHNDTYAAAPFSNIHTSRISTGFLVRSNDTGTNMTWSTSVLFNDANTNTFAVFNGTNFIFTGIGVQTNAFPGPTNTLDVRTNHSFYSTITSVALTGFIGFDGTNAWNPVLKIKNSGSTNITITMNNQIQLPLGDSNPYTLTNGDTWIGSFDFSDGQTNMMKVIVHHQ